MKFIPFEPGHIGAIRPQPAQAADLLCAEEVPDHAESMYEAGPALTGMVGNDIVFCIGKITQWRGRHIVWALMSEKAGQHMVAIVRSLKQMIENSKGDGRLELIVRSDFPQGCKLAEKILGFQFHHREERFLPDGADANIYVRYV